MGFRHVRQLDADPADLARLSRGERQLWEAAERALRQPAGKVALVLYLSRLSAPRDHHVRVARVLMQDTAQRHGGQVFTMANHDLVLLCLMPSADQPASTHAPSALPSSLAILFAADVPDPAALTAFWALDTAASELHAYLAGRLEPAEPEAARETRPDQPVSLVALQEILRKAPLSGLMTQQTGLSLSGDRMRPLGGRLSPAYQQVGIDLAALRLDPLVTQAVADPFLLRSLAETLDTRMIQVLHDDLLQRGRLLRQAAGLRLPVLIELGLRSIASPAFATLSRLADSAGLRFWIGVSLLQAGVELDLLDHVRGVLRLTGASLVLNRIEPAAFGLTDPAALEPDLVVLPWSPLLRRTIAVFSARAGRRLEPPRIILAGVDGEQAIAWGQAHGIDLFQGPYLEQVQAAMRMQRCHSAGDCTMAQCRFRAAALALPGRAGCGNPALLEAGLGAAPSAARAIGRMSA